MIHIATVHWKDERWVDIQLQYLHRHVTEPFRVYAWLNEVSHDHRGKYHYVNTEPVADHAIKLNLLADMIYFDSDRDGDLLVFLDGDAFPIGDAIGLVRERLASYPLVAVQRRENNGDVQPHPCFCATTVGFWKEIGGDWKSGHTWLDLQGNPTTDVGGNLLCQLERHGVKWCPILRSNRVDLHPLWFGVYEGIVYHHGAAFRDPISRHDLEAIGRMVRQTWRRPFVWAIEGLARNCKGLWRLQRFNPRELLEERAIRRNQEMIRGVYETIVKNPAFYTAFTQPPDCPQTDEADAATQLLENFSK
jgi:hypothetical protein